jgi:hypothetical protein
VSIAQAQPAIPPQDRRVWWFRVIADLCAHGYTYQTIAIAVGVGLSTVRDWKNGARPKYEDGDRLIELWCQVTKNLRESVPRISRYSHLA